MTNPITPTHTITGADGNPYALRYEHRDFATAEHYLRKQGHKLRLLGPQAADFWSDIAEGDKCQHEWICTDDNKNDVFCRHCKISQSQEIPVSFDQWKTAVLLYVGLIHTNNSLTLDDAQALIDFGNAAAVTATVIQAAMEALIPLVERDKPAAQEAADATPLPPANGGASDGPSPDTTSTSEPASSGD